MKKIYLAPLLLLPAALACSLSGLWPAVTPTPRLLQDTFFSGRAFIDANGNDEIDESDPPLPGARFMAAGFGAQTGADGYAVITIPGGWDQPISAQMSPPEGSGYRLIGPTEVILQDRLQTRADFLFAPPDFPLASPLPSVAPPSSATPILSPTPEPPAGQAAQQSDLTYCTTDQGLELKMDFYRPQAAEGPLPLVVYVHGGGWTGGDKEDMLMRMFKGELLERGYALASLNYRLAPEYKFPAQIQDVKCAIRRLRAQATTYGIDPERIGALGASAGGHLVALLGASDQGAGWDNGQYAGQSSRVAAVVDLFGPSDLPVMFAENGERVAWLVFGASSIEDPLLLAYSPVTYVTPDDPPFLLLHGEQDELVLLEQSQILKEKLEAAGAPVELVVVANAGHGFRPVGGGSIEPRLRELVRLTVDFFDQHLK
jgi:acetyl esterase/lipase